MSVIHGGQIAARQLRAAGIDTVFGVVAGPMIELFQGGQEAGLKVVGCRHEMNGGFMAQAWGYQRGRPGVMIVGSGPGFSNAVTPLYVATASALPLVVLGGSAFGGTLGLGAFQELDQVSVAKPVCKWVGQVDDTKRIAEWVHLALGKAVTGRPGGVYLDFPGHLVGVRVPEEEVVLRAAPEVTRPFPDPDAIQRTADRIARAERPLVLVGKGAAWADAGPALARLVDQGIPYVTSPMARGTLPDDHPNFANAARSQALAGADVIVMFGGRFNWLFGHGRRFDPGATIVQVDVEPEEAYSGAEVAEAIVADAQVAAAQLAEVLAGRRLRPESAQWLGELRASAARRQEGAAQALVDDSVPISPYRLVDEVRAVLPRDAIVVEEGETIMGVCRAMLPSYRNRGRLNAGTTGCMGVGAPYAVGAKLACPDAPVVAVLGDYAFGAAAMCVETAQRVGSHPVLVVANNEGIAGHAIQDLMPPGSPLIAGLLPARYDKLAEMVDGYAAHVERPDQIRPALEEALAADRIAVVHVRIDPRAATRLGAGYLQ
jgi:thiamine pyrophosphate-dependent acetolactate synthase large subunit-like protein